MNDWIKSNGISIVIALITFVSTYSVLGYRVTAIEARQDRQGATISAIQTQVTGLANDISGIRAQLNAIDSNVNYIRSRIDRVTQ